MRILHTADWHLGQSLRGHGREREHADVMRQLVEAVGQVQPDALIVAGDVFDSPNPPAGAQEMYFRSLAAMHRACPTMTTVVSAGNHDSALRLEAPRALWEEFRVKVVGNVRRVDGVVEAGRHLVGIEDKGGAICGYVLAVSYPTAACLPAMTAEEGGSRISRAVERLYGELAEGTRAIWEGKPLVLTGHLHVSGGEVTEGSERPILVGGEHAVPASSFPREAAYVALGHLHRQQSLEGGRVRYSGSLIPMSAAEIDYKHGYSVVDVDEEGSEVEHRELRRPLEFHRVPGQGFAKQNEVARALRLLGRGAGVAMEERPFVLLRLRREDLGAAFREELDQVAEECGLRILDFVLEETPEVALLRRQAAPAKTLRQYEPMEFFREAFLRKHGEAAGEEHLAGFLEVMTACKEAEQQ